MKVQRQKYQEHALDNALSDVKKFLCKSKQFLRSREASQDEVNFTLDGSLYRFHEYDRSHRSLHFLYEVNARTQG